MRNKTIVITLIINKQVALFQTDWSRGALFVVVIFTYDAELPRQVIENMNAILWFCKNEAINNSWERISAHVDENKHNRNYYNGKLQVTRKSVDKTNQKNRALSAKSFYN
jgi:hypothetical protein